jgi:hypothetical protein
MTSGPAWEWQEYAARIAGRDLTPAATGLLHLVSLQPGLSQQALAIRLGIPPSRFVSVLDELEGRHVLEAPQPDRPA